MSSRFPTLVPFPTAGMSRFDNAVLLAECRSRMVPGALCMIEPAVVNGGDEIDTTFQREVDLSGSEGAAWSGHGDSLAPGPILNLEKT